jgi:hypothetical protein
MISLRIALLASAATALSLAAAPEGLALTFTNYTTTHTSGGLGSNFIPGVYASGSTIYAATFAGLSVAEVPGPLPVLGAAAAFGYSRRLRSRLRAAGGASLSR